jgi:hypothetical protein
MSGVGCTTLHFGGWRITDSTDCTDPRRKGSGLWSGRACTRRHFSTDAMYLSANQLISPFACFRRSRLRRERGSTAPQARAAPSSKNSALEQRACGRFAASRLGASRRWPPPIKPGMTSGLYIRLRTTTYNQLQTNSTCYVDSDIACRAHVAMISA